VQLATHPFSRTQIDARAGADGRKKKEKRRARARRGSGIAPDMKYIKIV
jgi:hypothetical protein